MAGDEGSQEGPLHSQVLWRTSTAESPGSEGASCGCCNCQDTGNRLANPQLSIVILPVHLCQGLSGLVHVYFCSNYNNTKFLMCSIHVLHTGMVEVSHFISITNILYTEGLG